MTFERSELELSNGIKLVVIHNLTEFGLDIQAALDNWLARTKHYNSKDFCKYLMSKDVNVVAMTEMEYKKLSK